MSRGGRLIAVGISGLLVGLALNQSFIPGGYSGTLNGFKQVDAFDILPGWLLASAGPYMVHISRSLSTWFLPSFVRLSDLTIFNVWTGHVILALNQHGAPKHALILSILARSAMASEAEHPWLWSRVKPCPYHGSMSSVILSIWLLIRLPLMFSQRVLSQWLFYL